MRHGLSASVWVADQREDGILFVVVELGGDESAGPQWEFGIQDPRILVTKWRAAITACSAVALSRQWQWHATAARQSLGACLKAVAGGRLNPPRIDCPIEGRKLPTSAVHGPRNAGGPLFDAPRFACKPRANKKGQLELDRLLLQHASGTPLRFTTTSKTSLSGHIAQTQTTLPRLVLGRKCSRSAADYAPGHYIRRRSPVTILTRTGHSSDDRSIRIRKCLGDSNTT